MKYFNSTYWFKLWVLSAPLFNSKSEGIYAKSIDNKKIKDWASKNTTDISLLENQQLNFTNSNITNQPYNLLSQVTNQNINPIYQTELETSTHKHRHEKSRNRHKRTRKKWNTNILKLNNKLIINQDDSLQYISSTQRFLDELEQNDILRILFDPTTVPGPGDQRIFTLNTENYGYFRLPVEIRGIDRESQQSFTRNLELVFRTDNLYLEGFITNNANSHYNIESYYYFNPNLEPERYRRQYEDGTRVPHLRQIGEGVNIVNNQLDQIGSNYRYLLPRTNQNVNWRNIYESFLELTNPHNIEREATLGNLARSLGIVIFTTAEAWRFRNIYTNIYEYIINSNNGIQLGLNTENEYYQILIHWSQQTESATIYTAFYLGQEEQVQRILQRTANSWAQRQTQERQRLLVSELGTMSIDSITEELLFNNNIRIMLALLINSFLNCNNRRNRSLEQLIGTYWNKQFCDLKPQINNVQGQVTIIKILDKNNKGGNLKAGDIYVGTDNGVYLIHGEKEVDRFDNLNFPIKDIILDGNGSAYAINDKCEIYHLNLIGYGSEKTNMESCDLKKEIKLYYNDDKSSEKLYFAPTNSLIRKKGIFTLNSRKINPVDNYKKIEFLGDYYSDGWGARVKWGSSIYDPNHINNKGQNSDIGTVLRERKNKLVDNIKNYKVTDDTTMWWIENHYAPLRIQSLDDRDFIAWAEGLQKFGFTFYWENDNYYLQVITFQYLDWRASEASLECWMKIGNGIRLYNDDENIRTKREIFDKNNLEDKPNKRVISNELKNLTKWTDEFTKSINNEQHLPIDNKTNFVTSNITSL